MIEKINHYSLTNPASVYDEEALTALELAGRTAGKVNELIDATDKKLQMQDTRIELYGEYLENMQNNVIPDKVEISVQEYANVIMREAIDNGDYDEVIDNATERVVTAQMLPYGRFISQDGYNFKIKGDELVKGEQYSNTNGTVVTGATAYRSKYIYPCDEGVFFTFEAIVNGSLNPYNYIACYDHNMTFIGFSRLSATVFTGNLPVNVTLPGTCFVGFTFIVKEATTIIAGVTLKHIKIGDLSAIYHPFEYNNINYAYYQNHWCEGDEATLKTAENFDCVVFSVEGLKQVASTETNLKNAVFIGSDNAVISYGQNDTYEELTRGRLYDVPDGAVLCVMNFSNQTTVQGVTQPNDCVGLIHKNGKGLNGKRVLCVGDSITWLDGQQGYDDTNGFIGWQNELRKRGAIVHTYAYSGEPLTPYGDYDGIYNKIPLYDDNLPIDYVVIMAGSNDARLKVPLYSDNDSNYPDDTFNFALKNFIEEMYVYGDGYLDYPENLKVFVCSMIPSSSTSHYWENDKLYNDTIKSVCDSTSTAFIDIWSHMVNPNFDTGYLQYYDDTHPNWRGMAQIGRVIAREIEKVIE